MNTKNVQYIVGEICLGGGHGEKPAVEMAFITYYDTYISIVPSVLIKFISANFKLLFYRPTFKCMSQIPPTPGYLICNKTR